jgi:putative NADH-flavin reductase
MKIAVIGASGNAGQRIVAEARQRGHDVIAIARNPGADEDGVAWRKADLADPESIGAAAAGADAVVLSVRFQGLDFERALDGVRRSGVKRLLVVGGAASLEVAPGQALIDTPDFPDFIKPEAEPARQALNRLREERELDWTFLSPAVMFGPGERTGRFRLSGDALLTAPDGPTHISYEDYAVAMLDEIETPRHSRQRFSIAY